MSETATYGVRVDTGDSAASTAETAQELEKLVNIMKGAKANIAQMSDSFRALRGTTDEVKAAKEKLKAAIEAERNSISANSPALLKAGTSYAALADQEKKAAAAAREQAKEQEKLREKMKADQAKQMKDQLDRLEKSISSAGGPVSEIGEKFTRLKEALSTGAGASALFVGAVAGVVAGVAAATAAVADMTARLVEWIFVSGLANRQLALQREAWTGSESNAIHLGHQLDVLAGKVATPRAELEKLAGTMVKALNNSTVSGQGIVDTINAIAQASAAMGDEVGAKLGEIITRAKNTGRVQINPFELQGTGIKTQDIAGQLAKSMHVSTQAALQALAAGRVKVDDAAAAIRAAVEARFGEIDAKVRLGQPLENFAKRLQALTRDVNLEPILKGIESISSLFDTSTVTGEALKVLIERIAKVMNDELPKAVEPIRYAFTEVLIAAVKFDNTIMRVELSLRRAFAKHPELDELKERLEKLLPSARGIGDAMSFTAKYFGAAALDALKLAAALERILDERDKLSKGWEETGAGITSGLASGIRAGVGNVIDSVADMASAIKKAFTSALLIQSPSKVFAEYGEQTQEGYAQGVEGKSGRAQDAVNAMVPGAPSGGTPAAASGGKRSGAAQMVVNLQFVIQGGGNPEATAKAVSSDAVIGKLTKALEDTARGMGIAVQAEPAT